MRSEPRDLLDAVAVAMGVEAKEGSHVVEHRGVRATVALDFNSGTVSGFSIVLPTTALPEVVLRPETSTDRAGKALGINREHQTGDDAFDARVYIESDAPAATLTSMLASPELRRAVFAIFESGASSGPGSGTRAPERLTFNAAGVIVSFSGADMPTTLTPENLRAVLPVMARIASSLPRAPLPASTLRELPTALLIADVLGAIAAMLLAAVAHAMVWVPVGEGPLASGLAAGAGAWLVALPPTTLALRGRSTSLRAVGMHAVASLIVCLPLGVFVLVSVNGACDRSAPVHHALRIIACTRDGDGDVHVTTESWRKGKTEEFSYGTSTCSEREPGHTVPVVIHRGALGWEWRD